MKRSAVKPVALFFFNKFRSSQANRPGAPKLLQCYVHSSYVIQLTLFFHPSRNPRWV